MIPSLGAGGDTPSLYQLHTQVYHSVVDRNFEKAIFRYSSVAHLVSQNLSEGASIRLLRAVIFDFDGIIVDSEPLIFKLTQAMAAQEGWAVSAEEYYRDYLALDDRGIVEHLFTSHGRPVNVARRDELVAWKFQQYEKIIRDGLPPLPGAPEFVAELARHYPLAIASGSLRVEIEHLLTKLGLREKFVVLVTADDCERSKPAPEVYLKAFARLGALPNFSEQPLQPEECLAIEDAPLGVVAAQAAGLRCLAIANSRPSTELQHADLIATRLAEVDMSQVRVLFE
jgi:HAD superfamily hydrolase (TIGR01509 family)